MRDGDDLVARADAHRLEQKAKPVGAVAHPDRVGRAYELGQVLLEVEHLLAHDQVARAEHRAHGVHRLLLDTEELFARLPEPNRQVHNSS